MHMSPALSRTIYELLVRQADLRGKAPAIVATGREPLDYATLRAEVEAAGAALADAGIGRRSRVGLALPNAPESVTSILGVLCAAIGVPLNANSTSSTSKALLRGLRVDALLVPEDHQGTIVVAARSLRLPVLRVASSRRRPAGAVLLRADEAVMATARSMPSADDLAVVFHTSATTSAPKAVPLTHAQLLARSRAQPIDASDRCLLVPPIFTAGVFAHSLLSPLAAGAAIAFARDGGEDALLEALGALRITCFSANPAVLESLCQCVARGNAISPALRFIRSSASALAPELQRRLEAAFAVPIVQGYGMTEAGTIAQNPLPPAPRKPGSVGISVGPDIAIIGDGGAFQPANITGEIVVRGPATMSGYEDRPDVNAHAFHEGWFRTGDSGYLDDDGYLFITGRLKELINRGGMKVSPAEVDEVLRRHPDVAESVAFGVPHVTLGEDVVAAVVVRDSATVSVQQLREFAFGHLAPHEVPSTILRVLALPRTAAGKVNRALLAQQHAGSLRPSYKAPRDAREQLVATIIADVLHVERVGVDDNFFELGGDSIRGAQVTARVNAAVGSSLGSDMLFRLPTVANYAAAIDAQAPSPLAPSPLAPPPLVPRRATGPAGGR
jgi:acyl-CoA synthetase (AMP-forming)/AMP-acid ligase II